MKHNQTLIDLKAKNKKYGAFIDVFFYIESKLLLATIVFYTEAELLSDNQSIYTGL